MALHKLLFSKVTNRVRISDDGQCTLGAVLTLDKGSLCEDNSEGRMFKEFVGEYGGAIYRCGRVLNVIIPHECAWQLLCYIREEATIELDCDSWRILFQWVIGNGWRFFMPVEKILADFVYDEWEKLATYVPHN